MRSSILRKQPGNDRRERHRDHCSAGEKKKKDQKCPPTDTPRGFHVAGRTDGGNEKRSYQWNHGHTDRIDPECPDRCDEIGGANERGNARGRDGDAASDRRSQGNEDTCAFAQGFLTWMAHSTT
jgi:hypothetical protein